MKIKMESSPHSYASNEEYAEDTFRRQGIKLDPAACQPCSVRRTLAKSCLNQFYGRFGLNLDDKIQTEYITDPLEFYKILTNDTYTDINVLYLNDQMVQVNYKMKQHFQPDRYDVNILIALFTTSNARLRLYSELEKLGENAIYCDTDSIVYFDEGKNSVKTGDLLGEWTDELGNGVHIEKFVATAPKSYYYRTSENKEVTKIKGFHLNFLTGKKLNGEILEKAIKGEIKCVKVEENRIQRNQLTKELVNQNVTKTFSFCFDKRDIQDDYNTFPFGYWKV